MNLFAPRSIRHGIGFATICMILSKGVGYFRQLLVAYFFGISRHLDIYLMTHALTMLIVYAYTLWFDQMAIPRLIQIKEKEGEEQFRRMSGSVFTLSVVFGLVMSLIFVLLIPLAGHWLARGFSEIEKNEIHRNSWYFVPWIWVIFPYNALTAILKSLRYYYAVFLSDIFVSVFATTGFIIWHSSLVSLPLTLAGGYGITLFVLLFYAHRHAPLVGSLFNQHLKPLFKDFSEMFLVSQTGFLHQAFDRFFQSFLTAGSISVYSYVTQALAPLYELFSFDELFTVPLSSSEQRVEKLHRLLAGLLLLTVPLSIFVFFNSAHIIQLLYQRGQFGPEASHRASQILKISVVALISGTLSNPLVRTLQISDRVISIGWISLISSISVAALNYLLIFKMGMDVIGLASSIVFASYLIILVEVYLLSRVGVRIQLMYLLKYLGWALVSGLIGAKLIAYISIPFSLIVGFGFHGLIFGALILLFYFPLRKDIKQIVYG